MTGAMKREVYRVIDANFNRSREGLRVCEDITRFVINSEDITRELKSIRHAISGVLASVGPCERRFLLNSREAMKDIGKAPLVSVELRRKNVADIFTANLERAKESVRVLEEFFKLIDMKGSGKLSNIRFRLYEIEKKSSGKLEKVH